jgi:DNA-binding XRE family transcriptional regulator
MNDLKKLQENYSNQEIAASYVFPDASTQDQQILAMEQLAVYRKRATLEESKLLRLKLNVLQLKFIMEDYIHDNHYEKLMRFSFFLKDYMLKLELKQKEFAEQIGLKPVELSHYLNGRRKPNHELMIRLEFHSNNNIPAIYWYKILEKENEFDLIYDNEIRLREQSKVTGVLDFVL